MIDRTLIETYQCRWHVGREPVECLSKDGIIPKIQNEVSQGPFRVYESINQINAEMNKKPCLRQFASHAIMFF